MNTHPRNAMLAVSIFAGLLLLGCSESEPEKTPPVKVNKNPFPSTYQPMKSATTLIRNVNILDGIGGVIESGAILLSDGKIKAIGESIDAPDDAVIIDGKGQWLTPGIIDVHSHLGVYATPDTASHSDGNEMTNPVTAQVWAEHSIWPQDPGFSRALAGGITSL